MEVEGRRRTYGMAALAACACLLALVAVGCGSGAGSDTATAETHSERRSNGPTEAVLKSLGNSGVTGTVRYEKQSSGLPVMKIRLSGLERATGETQYFIWQMGSRHNMTSFASYHVPNGSKLSVNLEPNPESLAWLEDGSTTQMLITWVKNDDTFFASQEHWPSATDPTEIGVPVARGTFTGSLVGKTAS